jgi:RNA polymerase sigma-70 factor (ECF subfamily)
MQHPVYEQQIVPASGKMFRFARKILGDSEEAKDVVQDGLLRMWAQRERLSEVDNPEAWGMQVIKNLCLDRLKAGVIRQKVTRQLGKQEHTSYPTPYQQVEAKSEMARVAGVIDTLPERFRMIIHLREVEEYSYKEIASIMEWSMAEVKVNLFRARQELKKKLTENTTYGLS